MDDYREILYKRYVSTLKNSQIGRNIHRVKQFHRQYAFRFLPILRGTNYEDQILELGCGPGYLLEFLAEKGYKNIEGVDISHEQIQIASAQGLKVSVDDAFEFLSKKQGCYDIIFAIDFIEHFTKMELFSLFPMVNKALKKNGLLIIQTPNGQGLFPGQAIYGDLTHLTIFAEDSLRQILQLNGFEDIEFKETIPIPDSAGGKINLFLWKLIRAIIRIIRQVEANNSSKLWTENMIVWCKKI